MITKHWKPLIKTTILANVTQINPFSWCFSDRNKIPWLSTDFYKLLRFSLTFYKIPWPWKIFVFPWLFLVNLLLAELFCNFVVAHLASWSSRFAATKLVLLLQRISRMGPWRAMKHRITLSLSGGSLQLQCPQLCLQGTWRVLYIICVPFYLLSW